MSRGVHTVNGSSPEDLTYFALALNRSFELLLVELDGVVLSSTGSEPQATLTHLDENSEFVPGRYESDAEISKLYLDSREG